METVTTIVIESTITDLHNNESCVPLKKSYIQISTVVPAVIMIENLLILLAVFLYRTKLKHNNVYRYVASALCANVVASFLCFFHFLNYYYGFESYEPNLWWAFRKGMTLALSLILCGNIGLLIYAIEDSTYTVGRKLTNSSQQSDKLSPTYRRRKANALICLVWALPTLYGALAITPWNCTTGQCTCTLRYESGQHICTGSKCSKVYTPMSKTYLLVIVLLWGLECLALMYQLCKSIYVVKHSDNEVTSTGNQDQKYMSLRRTLVKYNAAHRVAFLLFFLFVCCTAPVMVLFVIDFRFEETMLGHTLVNCIIPLPLLYCLLSPLLVAHKLSGLKNAISTAMTFSCVRTYKSSQKRIKAKSSRVLSVSRSSKDSSTGVATLV